ncbi:Endoribonuclease L-PSP/chorismate mutase-like protein [Diaporthe sp. PMI_573]|nr:Endoribonuclease L-PSP/chorismate mutase-like protein [Diaporthaceae sp. PMI_573]
MSHLQYYTYPGFGEFVKEHTHYNQAVRVGDVIEVAGQGGWDRETREVEPDLFKQIDKAFDNVEHTLSLAGTSWKDVYAVKLYHTTDVTEEAVGHFVENMRKYMPGHQPILSGIGVASLAFGMKVEIEVRAHAQPAR